jgi:hypothetical protein
MQDAQANIIAGSRKQHRGIMRAHGSKSGGSMLRKMVKASW